MAFSITYTFSNGSTADATQVNTNFTDVINATSDGTENFSINALTVAGAAAFNGNVTLGNGSVDDITFTGSVASTVLLKTTYSYDIGTTTVGLRSIYLGSSDSAAYAIRLISPTLAAAYTFTLPAGVPSGADYILKSNASGETSWRSPSTDPFAAKTSAYTLTPSDRVIKADATGGAFTLTLPAASGNSGLTYTIVKTDTSTNLITVDGNSSETIFGKTTVVLSGQYDTINIVCDGSNWVAADSVSAHRTVSARIDVDGSSTVTTEYPSNWIASVSDPATGQLTINFQTGIFSAAPNVSATVYRVLANTRYNVTCWLSDISASLVTIQWAYNDDQQGTIAAAITNADSSGDLFVVIHGPR